MDNTEKGPTEDRSTTPDSLNGHSYIAGTENENSLPITVKTTKSFITERLKEKKVLITLFLLMAFFMVLILLVFYLIRQKNNIKNSSQVSPTEETSEYVFRGRVEYLLGSSWKLLDGRKIQILEKDELSENDILITDDGSRLVISFDDGSVIRLDENTKLTLSKLGSDQFTINEENGEIFARVQKDSNHKFSVIAGEVVVESLGTAFSIKKGEDVKVKVYENSVMVITDDESVDVSSQKEWDGKTKEIIEIDTEELDKDEFLSWSLKQEKIELKLEPTIKPIVQPTKKPVSNESGIILTALTTDDGIRTSWDVAGVDISKGFKLVKNTSGSPEYPGDSAMFLDSSYRSYDWNIADGNTWYIRVCQFTGSGCGVYSNQVKIQAPNNASSQSVSSISLNGITKEGKAKLTWKVEGYSGLGYKVVWSKNSGPTYPTREYDYFHYYSDPGKRDDVVGDLEGGKTYYFRVCEYLGGKCGLYSNEISLIP